MSRILAIEPDRKRKYLLAGLVREYVKAELRIAESARAAIALIDEQIPDLILAPTLLSPRDGAELVAHVRQLEHAPFVQLLTIPAFDMLAEAPPEDRRGFLGPLLGRRSSPPPPHYDRAMVGAQIADALARAQDARREHAEMLKQREELARSAAARRELSLFRPFDGAAARLAGVEDLVIEPSPFNAKAGDDRRTALRRPQHDLPWLSGIKLGWDADVALVNISTSGVLMETGSKFLPGSMTELRLNGPETDLVVPVRFVRSDVARIDRLGVKYHAAAAFDKEIDLTGPRGSGTRSQRQALADLLASALASRDRRSEPAHAAFVRGVADLVGACDVRLRTVPPGPATNRDGLSFDVPGDDGFRRTLQVAFDRHRTPSDEELKLLRAAALLTAAALELETPVRRAVPDTINGMRLLEECVA